jgi:hypothetical protein
MSVLGAALPRWLLPLVLVLVVVVVTVTVYDRLARPREVTVRILDGPRVLSTQVVPLR